MTIKNKILIALSVGAVLIVVASGFVRCSFSSETNQSIETEGDVIEQQEEVKENEANDKGLSIDSFMSTSWTSLDGKSVLTIIDGALIERIGENSRIIYFDVLDENKNENSLSVTVNVSTNLSDSKKASVLLFEPIGDGLYSVSCDELATSYKQDMPHTSDMVLVNTKPELFELFKKSEDDFKAVLDMYAQTNAPYATKASWDQVAWIDYSSGTYLTNFTFDDPGASIVTVTMSKDGKLSVS